MTSQSRRRPNRKLELLQIGAFIGRKRIKTIILTPDRSEALRNRAFDTICEMINQQLRDDQTQLQTRRDAFQKTSIVRKGGAPNPQERLEDPSTGETRQG